MLFIPKFIKSIKLASFNEISNLKDDPSAIISLSYIITMAALPTLFSRIIFYAFGLMFLIYLSFFTKKTIRFDWFFVFLISMLILSGFTALFDNARFLDVSVGIGESLILVALTSIFGVNLRSIIIASMIILVIYLIREPQILLHLKWIFINYQDYDILFVNSSHHLSFMMLIMAVYLLLIGKVKYSILIFIISLPYIARAPMLAYLFVSILFYLKYYIPKHFIKLIPPLAILGSLAMTIVIGIFYAQDDLLTSLSTTRSIFYEVIVNDLMTRGIDILSPHYPGYTSKILSDQIESYYSINTPFYFELTRFSAKSCVHGYWLEFLSDYGAISFLFLLFFFYKMTNFTNMYIILFYVIVTAFQCGALNPFLIFPFYIFYYLSTRLSNDESNSTGYQK